MSCWINKKDVILSKHKIISSYCSNYQLRPIVTLQCPVQMAIPISFGNIVTWPRCNIQRPNISVSWPVNLHAYNWISTIYYKTKCWCTSFFVYRVISRMNTISQQWSDSTSQRTYFYDHLKYVYVICNRLIIVTVWNCSKIVRTSVE